MPHTGTVNENAELPKGFGRRGMAPPVQTLGTYFDADTLELFKYAVKLMVLGHAKTLEG